MDRIILMANVISTQGSESQPFISDFQSLVKWANLIYGDSIESSLIITQGDEFQGIVSSPSKGIDIILAMEEYILEEEFEFKLRYILHAGEVEMPVDKDSAYEMLGKGLINARKMLNETKKDQRRFILSLDEDDQLSKMMRITQHFIDSWHPKDRSTVSGFLQGHDYKEMARIESKDESSLWRRRKSLAIDEYMLCKEMLHRLIN